jgi:transposase-like protein
MKIPTCPNKQCCRNNDEQSKVIRHGFFRVHCGRRRRYRCLGCGRTFSTRIHSAYFRLRCSSRVFDRVAQLSVEGMSRAAIARVEGVSWNAADRWVWKANTHIDSTTSRLGVSN